MPPSALEQTDSQTMHALQPPSKKVEEKNLLGKKAFAASLSAPRAPPYGSLHRNVLVGGGGSLKHEPKSSGVWSRHFRVTDHRHFRDERQRNKQNDKEESVSIRPHDTLRQRLLQRLSRKAQHYDMPHHTQPNLRHPHLPSGPEFGDQVTRFLGVWLPLEWQNAGRDSGTFRTIVDSLVTATAPMVPLTAPSSVPRFIQNTKALKHLRYGSHERQYIHLYLPRQKTTTAAAAEKTLTDTSTTTTTETRPNRLLIFVHGGAWGSGFPWMYRLVAHPRFLEQENCAVAIVGYRVHPDGFVREQMADCAAAAHYLQDHFPNTPVTLMGHSSGAHIALLVMVDRVIEAMKEEEEEQQQQQQTRLSKISVQEPQQQATTNALTKGPLQQALQTVDSFVGISGPYNISHHFDYEAARGVEEISPMKPVCGYTREQFAVNSPAKRLQLALARIYHHHSSSSSVSTAAVGQWTPRLLLLHGVDDETVPFTSTAEAARLLKSCGVQHCDEVYLPDTGHQDTVMHLMLGGKTLDVVADWIRALDSRNKDGESSSSSSTTRHDLVGSHPLQLVARSKL